MRQTMPSADENARALELATQVAALLEQLDALQPGSVQAGPGRISGPGLEIRRNFEGGWTVRTDR
ncbi:MULTISPECIES: hypothetical protein [Streptomyces]|uniref:Uncharacterized protein n=1 Tax=Streptomyces tsukubensis (strain DSM 42081 / NBRC 108919 / NRRL 18488 / 9993) TaxID=1114943 RepID=A0A7G3U9U5_STRT9|nr:MULTISPECIES: hypothetical protein [Streptomyces]MYS66026.1 hypothetical protein [Streptomyces sp. SID5473]QKM65812.1 hypothetical protein STSU_000210 [Streptomyces tsukubensis NRRL18488]